MKKPKATKVQNAKAQTTHKEVRRNWFPQSHITWFNFATQVFEVYKRPETEVRLQKVKEEQNAKERRAD